MKRRVSNLLKYYKKLNDKKEISSASVSFGAAPNVSAVVQKNLPEDFMEEFNEAIRSGDDALWRMWC